MTNAISSGKQGGKKRKASSLTGKDNSPEKASVSFNKVVSYSTEERCRRATLLKHFGERLSSACRGCDYCLEPQKVSKQVKNLLRVCVGEGKEQPLPFSTGASPLLFISSCATGRHAEHCCNAQSARPKSSVAKAHMLAANTEIEIYCP